MGSCGCAEHGTAPSTDRSAVFTLNSHKQTYVAAPLATGSHSYPFRVAGWFQGKAGHVVLDQMRTVDRGRLMKKLGRLSPKALAMCLSVLAEMFAP